MTKPITDTLHHIGGGGFITTATDQLAQLVKLVQETGRTGKLDLTIAVKKATRGGAMHITGKIKLTKPQEEPMEAMLFATDDGGLTQDNPRQHKLDLKVVVDKETGEIKQIQQG